MDVLPAGMGTCLLLVPSRPLGCCCLHWVSPTGDSSCVLKTHIALKSPSSTLALWGWCGTWRGFTWRGAHQGSVVIWTCSLPMAAQ